jgi:excisionase family DNA binding protein
VQYVNYFTNGLFYMSEMLTAKELQELLQVDRSTIYRMAEAGTLPAIKVGKQWRFPAERVDDWFGQQIVKKSSPKAYAVGPNINRQWNNFTALLPLECVQLIQDSFAELLGVMLVVTDINGRPITKPSNPCGLFEAVNQVPDALEKCIQGWGSLASTIDLEPKFSENHLGLLCARAMIRVGTELQGMVIAGCVAPEVWPPEPEEVDGIADEFGVDSLLLTTRLSEVFTLSPEQQFRVLAYLQRIATIVAHIVDERKRLVGRLEAIANLTTI